MGRPQTPNFPGFPVPGIPGSEPYLRVWNICTPGNRFIAMFTETKLVGWVRVIVWNTFQMSKHIRVT